MRINFDRLRASVQHQALERIASPVGRTRTGATAILRTHYAEIMQLHADGTRWTEIANALADQGVTQGDRQRITGRRLTALMRNIRKQVESQRRLKAARQMRNDLASAASKRDGVKLTLAPELSGQQRRTPQHDSISEDDIRQSALERHARLLGKKSAPHGEH